MFGKKKRIPKRPILIIEEGPSRSIPFEEFSSLFGEGSDIHREAIRHFNKSIYPYGMGKEWEFEK